MCIAGYILLRMTTMESLIAHQELFLRILSFLDAPNELVRVQGVNSYWSRMSLDPQLWKRLYLSRYPHPHHSKLVYTPTPDVDPSLRRSGSDSPATPRSLRPIARLPSRAFPPPSPHRSPSVTPKHNGALDRRSAGVGHAVPLTRRDLEASTGEGSEEVQVGRGVRNDGVDWKVMMRLGTNWSKGHASSQSTISLPPSPSPSTSSGHVPSTPIVDRHTSSSASAGTSSEQHLALSPSFIFTSSPLSPLVHIYTASHSPAPSVRLGIIPPPPGWSSPSRPDNVTAIAADQSVPLSSDAECEDDNYSGSDGQMKKDLPVRLAVFYQSGGYAVYSVQTTQGSGPKSLLWTRETVLPPTSRPRRRTTAYVPRLGDPVVLAIIHYPVLVTCTLGFYLSVYTLPPPSTAPGEPHHLSTLHSDVSYHPAALSLLPTSPSTNTTSIFRASLTYCTPVYPSSWTVAAQEFDISLNPSGGDGQVDRAECYHVQSGSEAGGDEEEIVWPRRVKPVMGVKGRVGGIGSDGRWCILSGVDNRIQVYALPGGSGSGDGWTPPPSPPILGYSTKKRRRTEEEVGGIIHSHTLLAHSAGVSSVSLSAGKCVSGGSDGRVLVWDLDSDQDEGTAERKGRKGRTVGYVEVTSGEERVWKGAKGPRPMVSDTQTGTEEDVESVESRQTTSLPHPQAISSAARSFFLPRPPIELELEMDRARNRKPAIRQLAFDEEKIVGLVGVGGGMGDSMGNGEMMKVWSFG